MPTRFRIPIAPGPAARASDLYTDKPAWYAYYHLRNLILVTHRSRRGVLGYLYILARAAQEVLITALWRGERGTRLRLLWTGARAGIAGQAGKGPVP